jgi:hypothetical protein
MAGVRSPTPPPDRDPRRRLWKFWRNVIGGVLALLIGTGILTSPGTVKIATWTGAGPPSRDQCNALVQAQGDSQQPGATGEKFCLVTGQGHTAYLKIRRIDTSNTANIRAYASVKVWHTTG